jgi:hypothetical protein
MTPPSAGDPAGRVAPCESPDPALDAGLAAFRADCRATRVAPRLAERVLAAVARGDVEATRFSRVARAYAAAAAVLAAAGVGGSLLVHRDALPATPQARSSLYDVEEAGILQEGSRSALDLSVEGGRR